MPVFHTKTIESILEPVAQQVSKLVILHEEAEDGNAMPDLARPVQAVKLAVDNLIKVGYETINNSEDQILKQDMPPALKRVEEASVLLLEASQLLRTDPYSAPARKKLIDGSRGILQGTSALLLAFDESEVRKIIRVCKNVLEYLAITEVVESMEDLVTFVKNLSPVLTRMTKDVDLREQELTHQVHREWLARSLHQVKQLTPVLISGIKIYITIKTQGGSSREAQTNRDYVVQKMCNEIHEIIRVLQLTTYDEDEWDADDITIMKKALNAIEGKMKQASDWLQDPMALVGSSGERALRQILEDAMRVADRCSDPADREAIVRDVSDIEASLDSLCELRQSGKGSSPQALSLARNIQDQLQGLGFKVARAVSSTERSGLRRPAHTTAGKLAQAQAWCSNPGNDDGGLGEQATRLIVAEARRVADSLPKDKRDSLLHLCNNSDIMTGQLADICRRGLGNSNEARNLGAALSPQLYQLKQQIQDALVAQAAQDFLDITSPLKAMTDAAMSSLGTPGRDANFAERASKFNQHAQKLAETAKLMATAGGCVDKKAVEAIQANASQSADLTPQVVGAARIVLQNPSNTASVEHFELLKQQWLDTMECLRGLVDSVTKTGALLDAGEAAIIRETGLTEGAIKRVDAHGVVNHTANIARIANRILQVAESEADNSEDRAFVGRMQATISGLRQAIAPCIQSAKMVAQNPRDNSAAMNWRGNNERLIDAVKAVRKAAQSDRMPDLSLLNVNELSPARPPPPPMSAPPRPPAPETDDEDDFAMPVPQANQPIAMAAHALMQDVKQWSSRDNEIIAAAKRMAKLMAKLSQLVRGEGGTKKDLIATARAIAEASEEVTRLAKELAGECTDKRMRTALLQVCERIPTIGTQLKILSTVKATMLGAQGSEEDQEATEMLVGNAQNLMQSVRETVRAAEAASIKIRVDSGYQIRWVRKRPWYQ